MLAFPTETFYGLGCCADQAVAVARVYQAKRRPVHMPLPLLAGSLDLLRPYVTLEQAPEALLTAFWPGPLTVVLTARLVEEFPDIPKEEVEFTSESGYRGMEKLLEATTLIVDVRTMTAIANNTA